VGVAVGGGVVQRRFHERGATGQCHIAYFAIETLGVEGEGFYYNTVRMIGLGGFNSFFTFDAVAVVGVGRHFLGDGRCNVRDDSLVYCIF